MQHNIAVLAFGSVGITKRQIYYRHELTLPIAGRFFGPPKGDQIMSQRLCFALDLVDDETLIAEYEAWHAPGAVWPEVTADIRAAGILDMEIWRTGDRMMMILTVADDYPRTRPQEPREPEWQALMLKFQKPLRHAAYGEKWLQMNRIFSLTEQ
jgi:L-rhamnose mutarotase